VTRACLLLPARARFAGEALPRDVARMLGRADRMQADAGAQSLFDVLPRGWPAAAVTRQMDSGDAAHAQWLRADPAYVRADINGARLLAVGETLGLDDRSAEALLRPLRPLFGDAGLPIDAGAPSAWYLRMPAGAPLPAFTAPDDALGADLFDHMPAGPDGRRWRALLSEAQVLLHQHPLNAERQARGLAPVNSVWFWGAGALPDRVATEFAVVHTPDATLQAFSRFAGARAEPVADWVTPHAAAAFDLRHARRFDQLLARWIEPALADIANRRLQSLELRWADGECFRVRASQRLRFWKRPLRVLAEPDAA